MLRWVFFPALVVSLWLAAGPALAASTNARPISPLGDNGFEDTLQEYLDSNPLTAGIDAVGDQLEAAVLIPLDTEIGAEILVEVAGFAPENTFGIYAFGDPADSLELFAGPDAAGDSVTVAVPWSSFGFYLTTPQGNTFYTEDSLNPNGAAQALLFGLSPDSVVVAFEDLRLDGSDRDFQDFVAVARNVAPIPEPSSAVLFGIGALLVSSAVRREALRSR